MNQKKHLHPPHSAFHHAAPGSEVSTLGMFFNGESKFSQTTDVGSDIFWAHHIANHQ